MWESEDFELWSDITSPPGVPFQGFPTLQEDQSEIPNYTHTHTCVYIYIWYMYIYIYMIYVYIYIWYMYIYIWYDIYIYYIYLSISYTVCRNAILGKHMHVWHLQLSEFNTYFWRRFWIRSGSMSEDNMTTCGNIVWHFILVLSD